MYFSFISAQVFGINAAASYQVIAYPLLTKENMQMTKDCDQCLGDDSGRVPPLSIPNREVKPISAEDTCVEARGK